MPRKDKSKKKARKSARQWAFKNGSGSLRRVIEEGLAWYEFYLHERVAYEVGTAFEAIHASRFMAGKALGEPDSPPTTETCWYARTLRWRLRKIYGEKVNVKVVYGDYDQGSSRKEGMALVIEGLDLDWIPRGRVLVAFTATYTPKKGWSKVSNPC